MGALQTIAARVGADERTLRRAVEDGTVRALRPSPRRLDVSNGERRAVLTGRLRKAGQAGFEL
jgi:hypothetical protein